MQNTVNTGTYKSEHISLLAKYSFIGSENHLHTVEISGHPNMAFSGTPILLLNPSKAHSFNLNMR